MKENQKGFSILIPLVLLLLFALGIRYHAFWLAHWLGDQKHYLGLAAKLERFGLNQYNLRGINTRYYALDRKRTLIIGEVYAASPDEKGNILKELEESGIKYYDLPLHHIAPGFPYMLMFSRKLFKREGGYSAVVSNLGGGVMRTKPRAFFKSQFYAVVVPLSFSLLFIFLTFHLGRQLFSPRVGLYAAFMLAVNPVDILTSQKIWADDMLATFVVLSFILLVGAVRKEKLYLALLAGASCGVATITKQTGGIALVAVWIYQLIQNKDKLKDFKQWPKVFLDKYFLWFSLGLLTISGYWFFKVSQTYGNPIYMPIQPDIFQTDKSTWFTMLAKRPPPLKFYLRGIPYLAPLLGLACLTLKTLWVKGKVLLTKSEVDRNNIILLWLWFAVFLGLFLVFKAKEHRYMLPAYPAIAILSAYILQRMREFLTRFTDKKIITDGAIIILLLLGAWWSIPIGVNTVITGLVQFFP